jgi:hypothetical protein
MQRSPTLLPLATCILVCASAANADCPDGSRALGAAEQQAYVALATAIKSAVPAAPAGWTLKDPLAKQQPTAPKDVCRGTDAVPGWYGVYEWNDQIKRTAARNQERDAKIRAASAWLPDEEKTLREYEAQARDLERKAVAAIRTNPDEAARIRQEEKPFADKANAVRKAHNERIAPDVEAIRKQYDGGYVNPDVQVGVYARDEDANADAKETLNIPGADKAFVNGQKEIVLVFAQALPPFKESGGLGTRPRRVTATVKGDREPAELVAKLLGASSLGQVGKR